MDVKTYLIDGKELKLKNYEDMTVKEEEEINKILGFSTGQVNIDPLSFLPLVLIADGDPVDYKNTSYKTIFEIMTDFLAERSLFLVNMPGMMKSLLGTKLGQIQSINKSTETSTSSSQE
ncbi:MAG: hypothetical protein ACM3UR_13270 [Bacteroidota bacterium]